MSLINDALKKAQKQRTGDVPSLASLPSVGGETPHRIAKRAKPAGFETLLVRAGVGLGVLLVVVVGGWLALREKPETGNLKPEVSSTNSTPVSAPVANSQASSSPVPQISTPAQPAFTLPVAPKPEPQLPASSSTLPASGSQAQVPASDPQVSGFRSQVSASVPSAAPTGSDPRVSPFSPPSQASRTPDPKPQTPVSAGAALKLEPRAIQFIENIKVAGIMARPTDSKVLMNDRVYRIGSLVEAEMGLTLVGITPNSLTFEDGNGARYTRTF